jgi:hypothetical protein
VRYENAVMHMHGKVTGWGCIFRVAFFAWFGGLIFGKQDTHYRLQYIIKLVKLIFEITFVNRHW